MGKKLTFQKGRLATALSSNRNVEWLYGGSVVIVMIVVILVIVPVLSIVVVGMVLRRRRPVGGGRPSHEEGRSRDEKSRTGWNVEEADTDSEKEQSEKRGGARAMERSLDLLSVRWLPRHSLCPRETIPEACGGKRRRERNAGLVGRRTGPLLSKF